MLYIAEKKRPKTKSFFEASAGDLPASTDEDDDGAGKVVKVRSHTE